MVSLFTEHVTFQFLTSKEHILYVLLFFSIVTIDWYLENAFIFFSVRRITMEFKFAADEFVCSTFVVSLLLPR